MTEITEIGYGKINLALAITGCREDGYHNIDTIFQSIGLYDTVTLTEAEEFQLTCSVESLPCDETNLAYRAWKASVHIKRTITRWPSILKSVFPLPPAWLAAVLTVPPFCAVESLVESLVIAGRIVPHWC